jgi:hypothetical protein
LIEWDRIQSWKYEDVARRVESMNHATQSLCPVLVLGEEDNAVAASTPPLREEVESQHAERRRRRDHGAPQNLVFLCRPAVGASFFGIRHVESVVG